MRGGLHTFIGPSDGGGEEGTRGHRKGDLEIKSLQVGLVIMVGQHLGVYVREDGQRPQNGRNGMALMDHLF